MRGLKQERGFTIVEMMVAVVVLLVGALGTLAMLDGATKRSRTASDRQTATALARQVVEAAKSLPYREISPSTLVTNLREDTSIAGSSASPWRIQRDGTTFTVQTEVCWVDAPIDGYGSHADGGFCAGGSTGSTDRNAIDHKRVTITASWNNGSGAGSSKQSALISARGASDAPGVAAVQLASPASSPITDPATTSASFTVTTTESAASVVWSLDGSQQDIATGSDKAWTFTWELPDADGVYDVSAQAFEDAGLGGEIRSATVILNRYAPIGPDNMRAAWRDTVVEATWSASRERDVIGYRVYRETMSSGPEIVCNFTTETTCIDTTPPQPTGAPLEYWAVAIDRDSADQEREGGASARIDVNANDAPSPPVDLILSKDAGGNTVLRWTPPSTPDPDGDTIDGYRIYRDGTAIGDRYDTVAGTETTATDPVTGGIPHEYWIATVDSRSMESTLLGPVTG